MAQLAVDLLINTLSLSRAGHLHHPSILPLAGSGAYSHTPHSLHTAAEGGDWCVDFSCFLIDYVTRLCENLYVCARYVFIPDVVYYSSELKLAVVQMRTPIAKVSSFTCTELCV